MKHVIIIACTDGGSHIVVYVGGRHVLLAN